MKRYLLNESHEKIIYLFNDVAVFDNDYRI